MRKRSPLSILFIAASLGCSEPGSRDEELAFLRAVLPESLLEHAHLEVASRESLAIREEGEDSYLGLRVYPGQAKVHGGMRAELSVDPPHETGETLRYSWRFLVPRDFVSDAPRNRWCLVAQWHDQPDPRRGETWEGFPSRSPPIGIGLGEVDGRLSLGFEYGPTLPGSNRRSFGPFAIERGKWHRMRVDIRWSEGADGKASVFLDGDARELVSADGPNRNNDYRHYWKLGLYRHPEIATDNWIYLDELEVSRVQGE